MKKNRFGVVLLVLLVVLVLLCGCQRGEAAPEGTDGPVATVESLPTENIMAAYTADGVFPSAAADGVYLPGERVSFMDFGSGRAVVLCAQSGCAHSDNTCSAWLEGSAFFGEYGGDWYTIPQTEDGSIRIDCITYARQTRRTVCTIPCEKGKTIMPANLCFSHGYAYLPLTEVTLSETAEVEDPLWRVNLRTGAAEELLRSSAMELFAFLGGSEQQVAVLYTAYLDEDYQQVRHELRLYDFDFQSYQVLCSSEEGFVPTVDPNVCYGDTLVYQKGDAFMLYDLASGQTTELCRQENVVNYMLMDGKILTVVRTGKGCTQFYADLTGGEAKELTAQRGTAAIRFSMHRETGNYFIGNLSNGDAGQYYIQKADFYGGRLNQAVALNP